MFNLTAFQSSKGAESGILGSALLAIRNLLTQLLHSPETGVIKLTQRSTLPVSDVLRGNIVCINHVNGILPYSCELANGGGFPPLNPLGEAIALGDVKNNHSGYFRFNGEAEVILEDGLSPIVGDTVYLSVSTYGKGTNVEPTSGGSYLRQIGVILNKDKYSVDYPLVTILIDKSPVTPILA